MDKEDRGCSGGEENPGVTNIVRSMAGWGMILGYFCYFGHFATAGGQTNIST